MSDSTSPFSPSAVSANEHARAEGPASLTGRRLRLWPAVVIIVCMWVAVYLSKVLDPGGMMMFYGMFFGPMVGAALIALLWLFFSRIPWPDRFLGLAVFGAAAVATYFLCHPSFRFGLSMYGLPIAATAW